MIKITIQRIATERYTVKENLVTKETPTEIMEDGYSNRKVSSLLKEYTVQDVTKEKTTTTTLLEQTIEDDSFDLIRVIAAVNKIGGAR